MKSKTLVVIIVFMAIIGSSWAAGTKVNGKIFDSQTKDPLAKASILLKSVKDSTDFHYISSDRAGKFEIENVKPGDYKVRATYVGYKTINKVYSIKAGSKEPLQLAMDPDAVNMSGLEIVADAPIGKQKEDTTEFNATAFKTRPDATSEDLIKKMPGIQVESNGTVKAQGEEVKKVLVDGKPFFGDDASLTLKNMPAEAVDKIQIYDKMSDQSEFSGFDDGNTSKAMNIITKKNKRSATFGKFVAGYGNEDKYTASASLNSFEGDTRITVLALSNNVNQQNFGLQDILGSFGGGMGNRIQQMGRRMGGGQGGPPPGMGSGATKMIESRISEGFNGANFFVGRQDGLTTTNAIGTNYSDTWAQGMEVSGSYFFNATKNTNNSNSDREYTVVSDSTKYYTQYNNSNTTNYNHRFNFQYRYDIDSSSSFMIKPSLNYQSSDVANNQSGLNQNYAYTDLYSSKYLSNSNSNGYNFSNELMYRFKFNQVGRTISFNLKTNYNKKDGSSDLLSSTKYLALSSNLNDSLNQNADSPTSGYGLGFNAVYTEPLGTAAQLQLNYTANYNDNLSDKKTYNYNLATGNYDALDSLLSNKFDNNYVTQQAAASVKYKTDEMLLTVGGTYQRSDLKSEQDFPLSMDVKYTFDDFLPSLSLNYKFSKATNLRFNYRTSSSAPSISQLQNVIDNSSPTQLSVGNPFLKSKYSHSIVTRFSTMSPSFTNFFMSFFSLNFASNYVGTSYYSAKATPSVVQGIALDPGVSLTKQVNLDGYWSANTFMTYGFPIEFIKSNANFNFNGSYASTPSLVNEVKNLSDAYALGGGLTLSSNIDENIDFTLTGRTNWNKTINSLNSTSNNEYTNYTLGVNLNWIFWAGMFINGELNSQYYTGLASGSNNDYTMLNLSVGSKVFSDNSGEIKLTMYDVLKQNKSFSTNITDIYVENSYSTALKQYAILTFTYNLKKFAF